MNYKHQALLYLVNKYEKSKLRAKTNLVNITIRAKIGSIFPRYLKPEIFHDYDLLHHDLLELEEEQMIFLIWEKFRKGDVLKEVILNMEQLERIYAYLGKMPKTNKEEKAIELCQSFLNKHQSLDLFLERRIDDLQQQKSVKKYLDLDDLDTFHHHLTLMAAILNNTQEYYIRELSIELFHDSKTAQKYLSKVLMMIKECVTNLEGLSNQEILEEFNIYQNPSWIKLKGANCLQYPLIGVATFDHGISFSSKDMDILRFNESVLVQRIITIENETSFERVDGKDPNTIYLYLAGFHNKAKREFLKRLYQSYPNVKYYHFGDIDCGGFRIIKHLIERTSICFEPLLMDLDTLKQYQLYAKSLEGDDLKHLEKMIDDPFFVNQKELFQYMILNHIKLEQECIQLNIHDFDE